MCNQEVRREFSWTLTFAATAISSMTKLCRGSGPQTNISVELIHSEIASLFRHLSSSFKYRKRGKQSAEKRTLCTFLEDLFKDLCS